jgi:hypothetical protein
VPYVYTLNKNQYGFKFMLSTMEMTQNIPQDFVLLPEEEQGGSSEQQASKDVAKVGYMFM